MILRGYARGSRSKSPEWGTNESGRQPGVQHPSESRRVITNRGRDEPARPELGLRHASRVETGGSLADLLRCEFRHVAVRRNLTRAKDLYLRSALQPNLGLLYIEALGVSGEPSPAYIRSGNVDQNTLSAPWSPGFRYSSE